MPEKYEFFAPIWRVMRDDNMPVVAVRAQVEHVAAVTKQATSVSDLRRHAYSAAAVRAPVVYLRGFDAGACTYFDDRRGGAAPAPHGACWYGVCADLRVVDVPGDHFSLLRQDLEDMSVIVRALKVALAPFGWDEAVRREERPAFAVAPEEIADIDAYLAKMGVKDAAARRRLEAAMPYSSEAAAGGAAAAAGAPVAALNARGRALLRPGAGGGGGARGGGAAPPAAAADGPVLVVCADAGGSLGGLEAVFAALDIPALALRLPADGQLWEAADLPELAAVASKALARAAPPGAGLVLAGVGFGGALAHELALQLDAGGADRALALALFDGALCVAAPAATLSWLPPPRRAEVCQAAGALYPAVRAAAGAGAPSVDAFAARLASIEGGDAQLDYVASFRPPDAAPAAWDRSVDALLGRLAYYKTLAEGYTPADIFPGQTVVFRCREGNGLAAGGPGGAWARFRFLVQPAAEHALATPAGKEGAASAAAAVSEALRAAVARRAAAEARTTGPSALALMSPRFAPGGAPPPESPASTLALVLPLNRLCPERRYILRRAGRAGTPPAAPPLARVPLWLLHTERGDVSGAQRELAAALPLPCYGLGMGADADQCGSLGDLAEAYVAAVTSMQPAGPYLLLGASIAGAALAAEVAARLEAAGRPAALVVLDGCLGAPTVPLHDATWYALFYLLREIGTLSTGIGEFVDRVRGAGSPSAQLKLLAGFKPAGAGVAPEAWDAAVYATLDRAAVLKRLARGSGGGAGGAGGGGGLGGAGAGGAGAASGSPAAPAPVRFGGPAALVAPRDRLGAAFLAATRAALGPRGAALVHVPLEARHTECLLTPAARAAAAAGVAAAVEALLKALD
jgi:thioesterase domain-containing protein